MFWGGLKVPVTCWLALTVSTQVGFTPLQPLPVHPAKAEPVPAASVSVTVVPDVKLAVQVGAQFIPDGLLEIVPVPVPATPTVRTTLWMAPKVAVTCWLAVSITMQVGLAPPQPPPVHPVNDEFVPAVSVRVTWVPLSKVALHVVPQLMPAGLLLIVPPPAPAACTLS
jgi:hypothetical protein